MMRSVLFGAIKIRGRDQLALMTKCQNSAQETERGETIVIKCSTFYCICLQRILVFQCSSLYLFYPDDNENNLRRNAVLAGTVRPSKKDVVHDDKAKQLIPGLVACH